MAGGGAFQTSREVFSNPIWQNIVEFRLFFLIYGNAVFAEEGVRVTDDLVLQRGQWLRSNRKLQDDLQYVENRQVKTYSLSTINRTIKRLITLQRVCTKTHELGTVFTVLNYEQYQGFGNYKQDELGTELGTLTEQSRNNNKNVYKGNELKPSPPNKKNTYSEDSTYFKMADYFYGLVKTAAHAEGLQHLTLKANMQTWADDMRKLVEIDKVDKRLAHEVMNWVVSDAFWKTNVLSAKKLREKFSELALKMKASKGVRGSSTNKQMEQNEQLMREIGEEMAREQSGTQETVSDHQQLLSEFPNG